MTTFPLHSVHYAQIDVPAFTRRRYRKRWRYFDPQGNRVTDPALVARLDAIGLPPAYADAWFAADPDAHILATGIDARGRKQYVYHPDFISQRDARKFGGCARFGRLLPRIRQRVDSDLGTRALSRERAVASIVRLLDSGRIRVGNEAYARDNRSFGATTLRHRHVRLERDRLVLRFRAKSGKPCTMAVSDRSLLRFVRQVQDLPGQHLFQYRGADGEYHAVGSADVNAYIHETMGPDCSAKDFRTWAASVLAFEWLFMRGGQPGRLREMLAHVADHLCNTPAVARKSYIHPALLEAAGSGDRGGFPSRLPRQTRWLSRSERGLIDYLDGATG